MLSVPNTGISLVAWLLRTVLHRVIFPAAAAKRARSSWLELRQMMARFPLFHQRHYLA
jgi:hypothetical protein